MLYQLYDINHAASAPMRLLAEVTQATFENPFLPASYTRTGRSIAATAELFRRTTQRFDKPVFGLDETVIDGQTVPVEQEIVVDEPFCKLIRFRRAVERNDPKVLLVAPLSGHHATLLRGTVEALLPHHDVYVTDWIDARLVPLARGPFDLDDYIETVMNHIRFLGRDSHIIAVCQPVVPAMAAVSLLAAANDPAQPRTMTLMGGPVDASASPTKVTEFAVNHPLSWFEKAVIATVPVYYPGAMRRVYPGFIQLSGFMSMNLGRHVGAHFDLFRHLVRGDGESADGHRTFYDEYLSVMDLPAEFYLETIKTVFQDYALPRGKMTWRGEPVRPDAITRTALLTVEGELDDISAPGQTIAAHGLCSGLPTDMKADYFQKSVGHYGIFNGRRWRQHIMPRIRDFVRQHDEQRDPVR